MWSLSLAMWLSASLPALLWASASLLVEGDNDPSRICKPAPYWKASKIGDLRDKLQRSNLTDVSFMVVNEREAMSRAMYWELKRRAPPGVPVYQQAPLQDDVWELLDGDKDDFLVYDRCGLLTFHIVLPYSFLHYPYIEAAIRATYLKDICNCTERDNSSTVAGGRRETLEELTQDNVNHTDTNTTAHTTTPLVPTNHHHDHNKSHKDSDSSTVARTTTTPPTTAPGHDVHLHPHLHHSPHDHQHLHHHQHDHHRLHHHPHDHQHLHQHH